MCFVLLPGPLDLESYGGLKNNTPPINYPRHGRALVLSELHSSANTTNRALPHGIIIISFLFTVCSYSCCVVQQHKMKSYLKCSVRALYRVPGSAANTWPIKPTAAAATRPRPRPRAQSARHGPDPEHRAPGAARAQCPCSAAPGAARAVAAGKKIAPRVGVLDFS
jgi:hypothetical protein